MSCAGLTVLAVNLLPSLFKNVVEKQIRPLVKRVWLMQGLAIVRALYIFIQAKQATCVTLRWEEWEARMRLVGRTPTHFDDIVATA